MALATIGRPDLNLSTADDITDGTGDIILIDGDEGTWQSTDLHTEIDIATMIHSGQTFTITLHGNVPTTISYMYYLRIYEDITDETTSYMVMLNLYTTEGYLMNPLGQYWTSTGWSTMNPPASVGTISGDEIEIAIPIGALTIDSSHNWYFLGSYAAAGNMSYADICPNSLLSAAFPGFSGPGGNGISGYEIPVLIGITGMFSVVFVYLYKKRIKN